MVQFRRMTVVLAFSLATSALLGWQADLGAQQRDDPFDSLSELTPRTAASPKAPARRGTMIGLPSGLSGRTGEALALQAALERSGFSPGVLDGLVGPKTRAGLLAYQSASGLGPSGELDSATRAALRIDSTPVTRSYVLTEADQRSVGPCPTNWIAKSRMKYLGFESLAAVAAFRGHCSQALLGKLNRGVNLRKLKPGDSVVLPNVDAKSAAESADNVKIDFATKTIRAFNRAGRLVALFHCSIAAEKSQRPSGTCSVKQITHDPEYTFKPSSWPEVDYVKRTLRIPPGPRNPVGVCWIALSKKGYGVHGTPAPELIGKTGSHGCVRLTNWDALRLAAMVRIGTRVSFAD